MMFESSQLDENVGGGGFPSSQSAKSRDNQPRYPVTVKQIYDASPLPDDKTKFVIDGVEVDNVKLVGMVLNKSERVTDVSFVIDDFTGRIGCRRWINDSDDTKDVESLMDGVYVRVHGHLKSFKGEKQVVVYAIRPVNDFNEIGYHYIECIHAHGSHSTKSLKTQDTDISSPTPTTTLKGPNGHHQATSFSSTQQMQFSQEYNLDGLGTTDKMVLDFLLLPSSVSQEKGVHIDEIAKKLKLSNQKITEVMESLESEGLVYSTIDEFHYKSTSS